MGRRKNLTGREYGKLTVLEYAGKSYLGRSFWLCVCECGNNITLVESKLTAGDTKNCGHCKKERDRERYKAHGLSGSRTYESWAHMRQRCTNPNHKSYRYYGGRGITVCDRWLRSFENFYTDMGERPEGTSLDRIDNSKGYEPGNCRWATPIEQGRNRRNNVCITYQGVTQCIQDWAEYFGVNPGTLDWRVRKGWTPEECLFGKKSKEDV